MRKIEELMIQAIRLGKNFERDNTKVVHLEDGQCNVLLHGNHIAAITEQRLILSHAGWRTPTTKSRLNAILNGLGVDDRIYQSKGIWFNNQGCFDVFYEYDL